MSQAHFVRKVMVDSRFRKSGSPGEFTFELNRAITLPASCAGFITDIELIHSWYNVDDHNFYIYFFEDMLSHSEGIWRGRYHRAQLSTGNYDATSLATELENQINAQLVNGQRTVSVTYSATTGCITFGVEAVPPIMSNITGDWTKNTSGTESITNFSAASPYVLSGGPYTLTITSFNAGPAGTRLFYLTETGGGGTHTFQWDEATSTFQPYGTSVPNHFWKPPTTFTWAGVYPITADSDVIFGFASDLQLRSKEWFDVYNTPSAFNNNSAIHYDQNNPRSINALLGALPNSILGTRISHPLSVSFVTNFLQLLGEAVPLYITSPSLTAFGTSLGPRGEHTIMKKINTKAPFGEVILDNLTNDQDYFVCGGTTLKTLTINLVNSFGHTMNLQADWSFSLVFQSLEG